MLFLFFNIVYLSPNVSSQSLQSWLRTCGLRWTTMPSIRLIFAARSRNTLPSLWAASKCFPPACLRVIEPTRLRSCGWFSCFCLVAVNRTPRSSCASYWTVFTTRWTEWLSAPRCPSRTLTTLCKSTTPPALHQQALIGHSWLVALLHLTVRLRLCSDQVRLVFYVSSSL